MFEVGVWPAIYWNNGGEASTGPVMLWLTTQCMHRCTEHRNFQNETELTSVISNPNRKKKVIYPKCDDKTQLVSSNAMFSKTVDFFLLYWKKTWNHENTWVNKTMSELWSNITLNTLLPYEALTVLRKVVGTRMVRGVHGRTGENSRGEGPYQHAGKCQWGTNTCVFHT